MQAQVAGAAPGLPQMGALRAPASDLSIAGPPPQPGLQPAPQLAGAVAGAVQTAGAIPPPSSGPPPQPGLAAAPGSPQMEPPPEQAPAPPPQDPGPPPENPVEQLWQAVMKLLRDEKMRTFRIDVESGSTVEISDSVSKTERTEYLTSVGNFLSNVAPVMEMSPDLAPVVVDLLSFTARTYKVGRSVESAIEEAAQKIRQRAQALEQKQETAPGAEGAEPPPEPDPHNEALAGRVQQSTQLDAARAEADLQKSQVETQRLQQQTAIEGAEAQQRLAQPPVQPGPGGGGMM